MPVPAPITGQVYADSFTDNRGYGSFIVTYRNTGAARSIASIQSSVDAVANSLGRTLNQVRTLSTGSELIEVAGKELSVADSQRLMETFARQADVASIEPNLRMHAMFTPNDTRYTEQWDLYETTAGMKMPATWDIATGTGVVVAVVDTGITPHSDLSANIVSGYDFVSSATDARDGNGRDSNPNDEGDWYNSGDCGDTSSSGSSWHGTHVAGTISAVTNNSTGIAGIAYNAKVQPVRVLARCGGTLADIADAITWASGGTVSGIPANPTPAKVINMSLGGGGTCASTYQTAITNAFNRGTVVVVAAGNENTNASTSQPANCANVVAVAALDRSGNRAYYSNYGTIVDVAAPGGDLRTVTANGTLSTLNTGTTTQGSATYAFYQGTSMATPHVAALAALIASKGTFTPAQIETYLKNNTRAIPGTGCSVGCGTGLVDALKTLQAVTGTGTNVAPTANFSFSTSGLTATFTDSSTDSDGTIASRSWNFGDSTTSTATNPSKTYAAAGTYSVSLTVTDNGGLTNTKTSSVTVSTTPGNVLTNGVAVTGLSASTGASLNYTMVVPAGATGLKFVIAGGSGDADLYVKFGSAPTDTVYDCRPYLGGNAETCNIATAQAGTYFVRVKAFSTFSGVSLTGSYTPGVPPGPFFQSTTPFSIGDNTTINSPITVSGVSGNAPATLKVAVNITHTYQGDLKVDLVAPNGTLFTLWNHTGGSADNIVQTFTVNASAVAGNGTWNLRVNDNAAGDIGTLNSWSLQF